MQKLLLQLLTRFVALALAFAVASCATLIWRVLPALRLSPGSSGEVFAVLTRATVMTPMWPENPEPAAGHYWILRRGFRDSRPDINRPVALSRRGDNSLTFGCFSLTVSIDDARSLNMHGDCLGSLNDPSPLGARLASIFWDREAHHSYIPGMEDRAELPARERIDRTVILHTPASLRYGEILELVNFLERAGATPVILQIGGDRGLPCLAIQE
ncbi:MAG: hypothetical protein LC803_07675 [Acidobacteria bacterium]|nr:hypothetical protein [Acidobacteriota bacterium]